MFKFHPFTGNGNPESCFAKFVKLHQTNSIEFISGGFLLFGTIVELAEGRNPREYCQLLLHNNEICFMASAVGKQALMVWE